jgi:hypothetical protein
MDKLDKFLAKMSQAPVPSTAPTQQEVDSMLNKSRWAHNDMYPRSKMYDKPTQSDVVTLFNRSKELHDAYMRPTGRAQIQQRASKPETMLLDTARSLFGKPPTVPTGLEHYRNAPTSRYRNDPETEAQQDKWIRYQWGGDLK